MSIFTVNDILENIWNVSGDKKDISDSEDCEYDQYDY